MMYDVEWIEPFGSNRPDGAQFLRIVRIISTRVCVLKYSVPVTLADIEGLSVTRINKPIDVKIQNRVNFFWEFFHRAYTTKLIVEIM